MPKPSEIFSRKFPHSATKGQEAAITYLDEFLDKPSEMKPVFLLRGYAGTGKTTLVTTLVSVLPLFNIKYHLLAPTGRAAKVMSNYCRKIAWTIHKKIYKQTTDAQGVGPRFILQKNYSNNTVFIVDEASMLSEAADFGNKGLLSDLVKYVFSGKDNRMILVGDAAQLPPVGQTISPALDVSFLVNNYKLEVKEIELTEVMRQESESGILFNATELRRSLSDGNPGVQLSTLRFQDIFKMTSSRLEDGLRYSYDKYGVENVAVICRSNRSAVQYNHYIRNSIFFRDTELEAGDLLMAVRNNYFYKESPSGFVANGDFLEVRKIIDEEERHGFHFYQLSLGFLDYKDIPDFDAWILADTLHQHTTSLSEEDYRKLYDSVVEDYKDIPNKREFLKAVSEDPFMNAIQVKYAYSLTCHKSQGGQWDSVFVDQGYMTEDRVDAEFVRWLYTAITRAKQELFLVNFAKEFFPVTELR
jgi:exodeoxyribonuclease-5